MYTPSLLGGVTRATVLPYSSALGPGIVGEVGAELAGQGMSGVPRVSPEQSAGGNAPGILDCPPRTRGVEAKELPSDLSADIAAGAAEVRLGGNGQYSPRGVSSRAPTTRPSARALAFDV